MSLPLLQASALHEGLVFRNAPAAWVIWLVIIPGIVLLTWFLYRLSGDAPPVVRRILTGLRVLVIGFIVALLMNPSTETQLVDRQKTLAIVMIDVSASMDHKDDYQTSPELAEQIRAAAGITTDRPVGSFSRLDLVKSVLDRPDRKFLEKLAHDHELRIYAFSEALQSVPGIADLEARGRATALGSALDRVLEEPEVKSRPVGGIVVITDGRNTAGPAPEIAADVAARRKIPIHTVGVGDPRALRDVELVTLRADNVVLVDDEMVLDLKVRNRGFPTQPVEVRLIDTKDNQVFFKEMKTLVESDEDQLFQVRYRPTKIGDQQWKVEVRPLPGEHSTDNNSKIHEVRVRSSKLTVLYIDGYPRWEYRKLKNFLKRADEAFDAYCLLLSAETQFIQEATDKHTPLTEFPQTEAELMKYDVVIFGDFDPNDQDNWGYLAPDPDKRRKLLENLRKFVENGGGFGMIAGESFSPRSFKDTPLEDVLPVVIDPTEEASGSRDFTSTFHPRLTVLGRQHPIMQLVMQNEGDAEKNSALWEKDDSDMQGFYWFSRIKKEKPGARVLAVHPTERNEHGPYPLMVAGTYGKGPVFFCGVDEVWRWFYLNGPKYAYRFWGNMVRYLGRARLYSGDKRFQLVTNRSGYEVGDRITITAYIKEGDFRPSSKPEQEITLRTPVGGGTDQRLLLKQVEAGVFERSLSATDVGDYQAWIVPEDSVSDDKISPVNFTVSLSDIERRDPILDEATLRGIARKTGGKYVPLSQIDSIVDAVGSETVEIPRRREFRDLRKEPWLPIGFLLLITCEWIIRKRFRYL